MDKTFETYDITSKNGVAIGKVKTFVNPDNNVTITKVENFNFQKKLGLRDMLLLMSKEAMNDSNFKKIINDLNYFLRPLNKNQRDLRTKLQAANRAYEIEEAEELKARFATKIFKNALSESAQNLYVHILAKLKTLYDQKVRPLIIEEESVSRIDNEVYSILEEIYNDMLQTTFEQNMQEIKGMLYFLTGNCHIDWRY